MSDHSGRHGSDEPDDEAARRLRDVLSQEARAIQPSGAGLARIQARIETGRRSHRAWLRSVAIGGAAVATAAVVAVVVVLVPGNGGNGGNDGNHGQLANSPTATASTAEPSPTPTPSASASPAGEPHPVTIYYVGKHKDPQQLLYRETVSRPWPAANAFISDAVQAMLTTPPSDPDYTSYWPAGTTVRGVSTHDDGASAVVDLSSQAASGGPGASGIAAISAWQLFYTVQGASPKVDSVELRVDGAKVDSLWGAPITNPLTTPDKYSAGQYFAHVWITSPANGATVPAVVSITGEAIVFEANLHWQVLMNGSVLKEGSAMASVGGPEQGTWQVSVTLAPGAYEIRAFEPSAKDGAPTYVDTKQITVQ